MVERAATEYRRVHWRRLSLRQVLHMSESVFAAHSPYSQGFKPKVPSDLYTKSDYTAKTSKYKPGLRNLRFYVYRYMSTYLCAYIVHVVVQNTCGFL